MVIAGLDMNEDTNNRLVDTARAYSTLALLVHYHHQTRTTLDNITAVLTELERSRQVFIDEGLRNDFDSLPRHHALRHLKDTIKSVGALSGVSTDLPENCHRLLKTAYKKTNKNDYLRQICRRLRNYELLSIVEHRCKDAGLPTMKARAAELASADSEAFQRRSVGADLEGFQVTGVSLSAKPGKHCCVTPTSMAMTF
jgi:hypothetical protein